MKIPQNVLDDISLYNFHIYIHDIITSKNLIAIFWFVGTSEANLGYFLKADLDKGVREIDMCHYVKLGILNPKTTDMVNL